MGYEGLRPKLNTLKYNPRSADPVNPVEGEVQYADGTVRPEGLYVYDGAAWSPVGSDNGISLNQIKGDSSDAELSIGNWVTYADAASSSPVDGTGGSPNITLTRTTTGGEVLNGIASFKLSKDAADRQGEGVSLDIATDLSLTYKPVKIQFNYKSSANFVNGSIDGVTPSDIRVFIYDITNAVLLPVFPNTLTGDGQFIGQFQASSSQSYRLILHIGSTNALAYDLEFDNVFLGQVESSFIQSDSDWVAYTPTYVGAGTVSTSNMYYRKQGPNIEISGSFIPGTPTAVPFTMTMPTGLLSSSDYTSTLNDVVGNVGNAGSSAQGSVLVSQSSNLLGATYQASNNLTKANGSAFLNSGSKFSVNAKVKIQGWTSGYATPAVSAQNVPVVFSAQKNGGSITADTAIASWTTTHFDSVGAFNSSTGIYTVKQPGYYDINWAYSITSADTAGSRVLVNGSPVRTGIQQTSSVSKFVPALLYLNVGDTVAVSSSISATLSAASTTNIWTMTKQASPAAFLTIPKVAYIKDVKSAGTPGGSFTAGSFVTRTLNTLSDPYGIAALSSNQFTLQPGTYLIEASAPAYLVDDHQTKIRNITDSSDALTGAAARAGAIDSTSNRSFVEGVISISSAKAFELQHRCGTTSAQGLGRQGNFGIDETYAVVKVTKLL